jgi:hypothetical protein
MTLSIAGSISSADVFEAFPSRLDFILLIPTSRDDLIVIITYLGKLI